MKKLPEIYKNQITKSTNQKYNYSKKSTETNLTKQKVINQVTSENKDVILKEIFKNKTGSYTKKVQIETSEKILQTRLIYQTEKEVLTIDNEKIPLEKIISIQIL